MYNYSPYNYSPPGDGMHRQRCACKGTSALPENPVVAMAYVPYQECNDVYSCDKALSAGTIFPVLDKPFLAGCCK